MVYALDKALQEMSLEENKPIKLKNLSKFSSCERNACSLMGKLLCPEIQKMSRFIHDMPRLWHINSRARGIALSEDTFQFIFDSEHDLETVLSTGAWTYEDWSIVLERWVEKPPADYLQILPVWIRLRNVPVNFYTADTFEEIADNIGQVVTVAFDPLKPQSKGFVRVKILFNINRPLWNFKDVEMPNGETVSVGIEYERVRKRCFQCRRLTHDKLRCPLNPNNWSSAATGDKQLAVIKTSLPDPKISEDDPLYGVLTNDDVGIDRSTGRPKISKDVLDEMRAYLSVEDAAEKTVRIIRVRKSVWGLDGDPKGQKTLLRLEPATEFTTDINKGKGIVFDFEKAEPEPPAGEKLLASAIKAGKANSRFPAPADGNASAPLLDAVTCPTVFSAGINDASGSGISRGSKKKRSRPSQHKRRVQASKIAQALTRPGLVYREKQKQGESEVTLLKRKAAEEETSSPSKLAKRGDSKVVPREEPPTQL